MSKGYLPVSKLHQLYYETYGNPKGIPILFLHGGPGAGFSDADKDFFDANKFYVIFFDQRSSGRSQPFGSIEENTTEHLVADINVILDFFKIEKVLLFGGSWGSTLALVYAIRFPQRVTGMILRGIFLGNQAGIDHFVGGGAGQFYPEAWEHFMRLVPTEKHDDVVNYYLEKMQEGNETTRRHFAYEWAFYEMAIYKQNANTETITNLVADLPYESLSILEAYYSAHRCFLPDGYILENCHLINHIPIDIIQGRQDMICPPIYAYQLHKKLKQSTIIFTNAGHASTEVETKAALIKALEKI